MRNTEGVEPRPTAPTAWSARPQADREAWNAFRRASAVVLSAVDSDLQRHLGVGYSDIDALVCLSAADEQCQRMAPLARAVSRSPSALTRLVDRLEARGLVERTRLSPTDVTVEITPAGLDLLADAAPRVIDQVQERFWSRLTDDERDCLSVLCRKLLDDEPPHC